MSNHIPATSFPQTYLLPSFLSSFQSSAFPHLIPHSLQPSSFPPNLLLFYNHLLPSNLLLTTFVPTTSFQPPSYLQPISNHIASTSIPRSKPPNHLLPLTYSRPSPGALTKRQTQYIIGGEEPPILAPSLHPRSCPLPPPNLPLPPPSLFSSPSLRFCGRVSGAPVI